MKGLTALGHLGFALFSYHLSFVHSFNKYLLSAYYVPGTVLVLCTSQQNKDPCPWGPCVLVCVCVGHREHKQ